MTNNVIPITNTIEDRAALMADFYLDTTATLKSCNAKLDRVLADMRGASNDK